MTKRILLFLLTAVMLMGTLAITSFAAEENATLYVNSSWTEESDLPDGCTFGVNAFADLDTLFNSTSDLSGDVTVKLLSSVVEAKNAVTVSYARDEKYIFVTDLANGATINFLYDTNWIQLPKFAIDEDITMNIAYLYVIGGDVDISGTVNTNYLYCYGTGEGVNITETGVVNANVAEDKTVQVKGGTVLTVEGELNTNTLNVWTQDSNGSELIVSGENAEVNVNHIHAWSGASYSTVNSIVIEDGGVINVKNIEADRGATIEIDNATLNVTETCSLGYGDNIGTMTITNGGELICETLKISDNSSVTADDTSSVGGAVAAIAAEDNTYYYDSLLSALENVEEDETIILHDDIVLSESLVIPDSAKFTLDLNGQTVSYSSDVAGEAMIVNNGDLTITDSSEEKDGKITFAYVGTPDTSYGKGNYTVVNNGVLTLENGTVENTTAAMSHASYAINTNAGATLNIKGGKVLNLNGHTVRMVSFGNGANNVNISGGYIEGTRAVYIHVPGNSSAATAPEMNLTISGGELKSNESTYNLAVYVYSYGQSAENVTVTISDDAVINGNVAVNGNATRTMAEDSVSVTGGTINGDWGVFSYADDEDGIPVISITGGVFSSNYCEYYAEDDEYEFAAFGDGYRAIPADAEFYDVTVYGGVADIDGVKIETAIEGDTVTITATEENIINKFITWIVISGDVMFEDAEALETTFTMPASDVTVMAYYEYVDVTDDNFINDNWALLLEMLKNQKYDVEASATEGGKITPEGTSVVKYNEDITYEITPDEGYFISDVIVNGKSVGAVDEYTFENVSKDQTIHVVFEKLPWENPYKDVSDDAWYYDDVAYVSEAGIMNGTSENGDTFSPDTAVNRAMLVTMLWRLEGCPEVESDVTFEDVKADEWYSEAVEWAYESGIALGYGNGFFGTEDEITREQVITILYRYASNKGWVTEEISDNATAIFGECTYSDWATDAVLWADMSGLFYDIPVEQNDMTEVVTRAEIAAYFARLYEFVLK